MKLGGIGGPGGPEGPREPGGAQRPRPASKAAEPAASNVDRLELSPASRQLSDLVERATALPESRADLIERVRQSLSDGSYQVDARELARRILEFENALHR